MNSYIKLVFLALFLFFTPLQVHASCVAMHVYSPDQPSLEEKTSDVFVGFDGKQEKFIVQSGFAGKATDFGEIFALPSKPTLGEVKEDFFDTLRSITELQVTKTNNNEMMMPTAGSAPTAGVSVIEQKDVGDFSSTVFTATDTGALEEWLKSNNYVHSKKDSENFDYYIKKGGYYFVALKINFAKVETQNGFVSAWLKPFSLTFESSDPYLPMRVMAGDDKKDEAFNLYLMTKDFRYIPGVALLASHKIKDTDSALLPDLASLAPVGSWLTKMYVQFSPAEIHEDLKMIWKHEPILIEKDVDSGFGLNPELIPFQSGIQFANGPVQIDAFRKGVIRGVELLSFQELSKIPTALLGRCSDSLDCHDMDGDGLPDDFEYAIGTDPQKKDSDGDKHSDYDEVLNGYNPLGVGRMAFDTAFASRKAGILAVEQSKTGTYVWYVSPVSQKKYFLGTISDVSHALPALQKIGLQITTDHLKSIVQRTQKNTDSNTFYAFMVKKGDRIAGITVKAIKQNSDGNTAVFFKGPVTIYAEADYVQYTDAGVLTLKVTKESLQKLPLMIGEDNANMTIAISLKDIKKYFKTKPTDGQINTYSAKFGRVGIVIDNYTIDKEHGLYGYPSATLVKIIK